MGQAQLYKPTARWPTLVALTAALTIEFGAFWTLAVPVTFTLAGAQL